VKLVPVLDNPSGEEIFANIQFKPPLAQLEPISSCPITSYLGKEIDPHLATTSFQAVVESSGVSPEPPFLQAKQSQFPQPLFISELGSCCFQHRKLLSHCTGIPLPCHTCDTANEPVSTGIQMITLGDQVTISKAF